MSKFHQLRRTAATLVCQSAGLEAAASLLGHASPEITRRSYIDPTKIKHDITKVLPKLSSSDGLRVGVE